MVDEIQFHFETFEIRFFELKFTKKKKYFQKLYCTRINKFFDYISFHWRKKVINNVSLYLTKSKVFCNLKGEILSYGLIWIYQTAPTSLTFEFFKGKNVALIK